MKSTLDGFAALAFSAALGWGVGFSVLTILVFQGALSLLAGAVAGGLRSARCRIASVTATGGLLILAIGLRLLDSASPVGEPAPGAGARARRRRRLEHLR